MNFPEGLTGFRPLITDWAIDWSRFIPIEEREYGPNPDDPKKAAQRRSRFAKCIGVCSSPTRSTRRSSIRSAACRRAWSPIQPPSLAARNLRRGNQFGLPTGQEAAKAMGLTPLDDAHILIGKAAPTQIPSRSPISRMARSRASARSGPMFWPRRCRTLPTCAVPATARREGLDAAAWAGRRPHRRGDVPRARQRRRTFVREQRAETGSRKARASACASSSCTRSATTASRSSRGCSSTRTATS